MYTDADVSTLFVDGIEGKHWVWTDDTHTFVTTPEGVETSASGYPVCDWAMPNQQIDPCVGRQPRRPVGPAECI